MVAEDVADDQLAVGGEGLGHDAFGIGHRLGEWFFDKNVATGIESGLSVGGVRVWIGGDGNGVRLGNIQGFQKIAEFRVTAAKLRIERSPAFGRTGDDSADFKSRETVVG